MTSSFRYRPSSLRALQHFAGELAHVVLNPLNSATLKLAVLEARRSDSELRAIRAELARIESIVADFLAFSRSGASQTAPGRHGRTNKQEP